MVIAVALANWEVHKTLVDQGSSTDILYWPFLRLDVPHSFIQPHTKPLVGFVGRCVHTRGYVDLLTTFGAPPDSRRVMVQYILVEADTSYNIIIGRPTLNQLGAVVSTPHLTMKFLGHDGKIFSVKANQKTAQQCHIESLKIASPGEQCKSKLTTVAHINHEEITDLDPRSDAHDERPSPVDELDDLQIGELPGQIMKISKQCRNSRRRSSRMPTSSPGLALTCQA
ncbi:uncharacterized protein LOC109791651 [Cajanus cajan]|uniref:uncharacterized protein LOC109791651 n=1 Tax=Cajanus cajan TaxID=3821 RepID=UPI00098DB8C4|nr:uncharacterized protein LOC109791651 [Cajanus cajan]